MQSLYFLLPLLVIYEIGALTLLSEKQLTATRLLGQFFAMFGVTGVHLPAIAVVGALLGMHIVRKKDPWLPELKLYPVMWGESLVLAMPLFVLMTVLLREQPLVLTIGDGSINWGFWRRDMVIAIGAGVYEELLFRLVAIAAIHGITKDLLSLPEEVSVISAVVISSLGFALVHFVGDHNPFTMTKMLFYTVAGVYFAAIYLTRGFGIVVAVHALYDVLVFTKIAMTKGS